MNASSFALMLLMVTSFITTRFFIKRELVDRQEQPGVQRITYAERRRIRQIVAVALAHSFGIAVLLSAIFVCNLEDRRDLGGTLPHSHTPFLRLIPREAVFDLGAIAEKNHRPFIPFIAVRSRFQYYPTIILTWTALGLFFGVFLEGFMKGARLRGARPDQADAEV
jgi:hypothetical protein